MTEQVRILIVEDEFFVGIMLEEDLRAEGFATLGPFTRLSLALEASRREAFDFAILDVNLNDEMVFPLADELLQRAIPFIFLTGYSELNLPERFRRLPRLAKPYQLPRLMEEIRRLVLPGL